jgi:alpha 1,2-mannosyltransferase
MCTLISEERQLSLHYILSITHDSYGRSTSISNLLGKFGVEQNATEITESTVASGSKPMTDVAGDRIVLPQKGEANAVLLFLCRNTDIEGVVSSVRQLEDRFNAR